MKADLLHFQRPLLHSPFHPRVAALNRINSWAPWGGYTTALSLDDESMEYTAIRNQVSVYDLSPMVKYRVMGKDAEAYLNRVMIRNVSKLKVGQVHYTAWCDDAGKLLDDGTLFHFAETEYWICCQERHLPWFRDAAIGYDVTVEDVTTYIAALSLQGPCAFAVLEKAGFAKAAELKPFQMMSVKFGGKGMLTISRTGFTGDLGYELWTTPDRALELWDLLFDAGALFGIRAIGTTALNMARLEAGFIITNYEFTPADQAVRADRTRSPFEVGLEWMIDFDKGHFNGRRALLRERESKSTKWALVGLELEGNISGEHSLIYHNKQHEVGHITGAVWSPVLKSNIALAMLERPYHDAKASDLWVEIYALRELQYVKLMVKAKVVPRPFFNPPRRRANPPGRF
ncbi:aminomethyltransferase family protein [Aestuariivirga litoralis]|uniref:aminomethyltransferase family protein n=1 Tax=Aestuariivirga litoralis TaxID=2650924 RepID=UPI0018C5CCC4|nr:aminomethyltransferase family protein [Aestuariivirga litoralis]MBG1230769.1 aminomethyl transferase family protein [Aestuariivirga litoralis]